jgi:hypothetical protein
MSGRSAFSRRTSGSKSLLFLKKKKQKDFPTCARAGQPGTRASGEKFFGSFFQKRTA